MYKIALHMIKIGQDISGRRGKKITDASSIQELNFNDTEFHTKETI